MIYRGEQLRTISFPLGGVGTGCVGVAGNGALVDWEIFGKPNKNSDHGFSHFAVKVEDGRKVVDARVLVGDMLPPYVGEGRAQWTYGFGVRRTSMQGLPHFASTEFVGEFPTAAVKFIDKTFPGCVTMHAFNPFIPQNDADSTIPAAFLAFEIRNTTKRKLRYTFAGTLANPDQATPVNRVVKRANVRALVFDRGTPIKEEMGIGTMTLATDADDVSIQEYWYRGFWFDNLGIYWRDFTTPGPIKPRRYRASAARPANPTLDHGTLSAHIDVPPGQTKRVRFVISWHFPYMTNYWSQPQNCSGDACTCEKTPESPGTPKRVWKHYYATLFDDSLSAARYAIREWDRLERETFAFKRALFGSTLPATVIDAVSANISILKSPTVLRLQDGSMYGFEGCHSCEGCCEGSCTHVWTYAYAAAFLFPNLERSMRAIEYAYNLREDGMARFRTMLPLDPHVGPGAFPCVDGQYGGVIKMYREWKLSGDSAWLGTWWPAIKKAIEFAWSPTNDHRWDMDRDGVIEGRQHHTLDVELFGPNSWLTGMYLAALKAAAEMAEHLGESTTAKEYRALFERGKAWVDRNLFNGEYYAQKIDLDDRGVLKRYCAAIAGKWPEAVDYVKSFYWSDEHRELKCQIGEGCLIDQVLAQWHANLVGLGEIFDRKQVKQALASIYRYNFVRRFRDHFNPCRLYGLNDEAGVVICSWPNGVRKPAVPVPYAEESMHGFEYQAACHMIQEGLVKEGLDIVAAVRARYDGSRRNPWNEFECGSNYARSMASFALLSAMSGFSFDATRQFIGFAPVGDPKEFSCFWAIDGAWGTVHRKNGRVQVVVEAGRLTLASFSESSLAKAKTVRVAGAKIVDRKNDRITFACPVIVEPGRPLTIALK